VLYGDVPLTQVDTLRALVAEAEQGPALLTVELDDPSGYGRILRDAEGNLQAVVEDKDASEEQRAIGEINTGVMAAPAADFLKYLPAVGNDNKQGEYYLPDVLSMTVADGRRVNSCLAADELEAQGVNDRLQLNWVERAYQRQRADALMRAGVALADRERIDVRGKLTCGSDVSVDINAVFEGEVTLGDGVTIGPNCGLKNVTVGEGATIHAMSHLEDAVVGRDCNVGPFARVRPGTELASGARIGNFVETKKARIGEGSKVNHLTYIGDCDMGAGVNVGAGTITCNYDGVNKHKTTIGDGVFVGSNSTLVAPVTVADQGFVGAGSTVTRDIDRAELGVSRAKQRNIQGWKRPGKKEV
jgi:bifunctional UDP-N-acetylglucosamine pyrophosphorylase/glucosamine-1-phosphate N-acetyltransferase